MTFTSDNALLSRPSLLDTLAAPEISPAARNYLRAAIAASSLRAYQSDLRHFFAWGGSLPATDRMVADYLAAHAGTHATATLVRRLVAISKAQTMQGLASPAASQLVRLTMRGIKRTHGRPQRRVSPALKEDLLAMVAGLGDGLKDRRDRALLLVGFAGAFRRSELVSIARSDIEPVALGIVITIRHSKTDQEGCGRRIAIPYARRHACPVESLNAWLKAACISTGPIFRPVTRQGRVRDVALSSEAVALVVKARAAAAGLDPQCYSGHSLRAGFATSAARAGVPAWKIKAQTGHASDAMLARYIRDGELFTNNAAGALL